MIPGKYIANARARYKAQWSPDAKSIYFVTGEHVDSLFVMGIDGTGLRRLSPTGVTVREFEISPDGRRIVFVAAPPDGSTGWPIYVMNTDGSDMRKATDNRSGDVEPKWSPDGQAIAFTSARDGNPEIYLMKPGGGDQRNLSRNAATDRSPSWVPEER
jgi:Tol biopolymer transport system component